MFFGPLFAKTFVATLVGVADIVPSTALSELIEIVGKIFFEGGTELIVRVARTRVGVGILERRGGTGVEVGVDLGVGVGFSVGVGVGVGKGVGVGVGITT